MLLSPHFTLDELTRSSKADELWIQNTPSEAVVEALRRLAGGLEAVRVALGDRPISVSSGYRCPALNEAVGGSEGSQHMKGEAADFSCPEYGSPIEICRRLIFVGIGYDQLILESTWVHVSFCCGTPRQDVFTKLRDGGYVTGLITMGGNHA